MQMEKSIVKVTVSVDRRVFSSSCHIGEFNSIDTSKKPAGRSGIFLPINSKSTAAYIEKTKVGEVEFPFKGSLASASYQSQTNPAKNEEVTPLDKMSVDKQRVTWRSGEPTCVSIKTDGSPCVTYSTFAEEFMKRLRTSSSHECVDGVYVYPTIDSDECQHDGDDSPILTF